MHLYVYDHERFGDVACKGDRRLPLHRRDKKEYEFPLHGGMLCACNNVHTSGRFIHGRQHTYHDTPFGYNVCHLYALVALRARAYNTVYNCHCMRRSALHYADAQDTCTDHGEV